MDESEREALRVPVWCPQCDLVMRDDSKAYYRWRVCLQCFIEFIEHRESRWESGWRPSTDEMQRFLGKMNVR